MTDARRTPRAAEDDVIDAEDDVIDAGREPAGEPVDRPARQEARIVSEFAAGGNGVGPAAGVGSGEFFPAPLGVDSDAQPGSARSAGTGAPDRP